MWTKQDVKREVDKIRAASLGEVILFAGHNLTNTPYQIALTHAGFQANVGIYGGYSRVPAQHFAGGKIRCVFKTYANIEIAVAEDIPDRIDLEQIERNGQVIRTNDVVSMIYLRPHVNMMWLDREGTVAYVGPDDVKGLLQEQSKGALEEFITEYIAQFRDVKD